MRILLKVTIPCEAGNAAIRDGRLQKTIQSYIAEFRPESIYFITENGKRTALIMLDIRDASQMPAVAEPWFLALNADVEFIPAMTAEDLQKAAPRIEQAIKNYG